MLFVQHVWQMTLASFILAAPVPLGLCAIVPAENYRHLVGRVFPKDSLPPYRKNPTVDRS